MESAALSGTRAKLEEKTKDRAKAYRRLLIEIALEEQHYIRLEQSTGSARRRTRVARAVEWQAPPDPASGEGILIIDVLGMHQLPILLAEVEAISLATEHLPSEQVSNGGLAVGDSVCHAEMGFGIVQAFAGNASDRRAIIRFEQGGKQTLDAGDTNLEKYDASTQATPGA